MGVTEAFAGDALRRRSRLAASACRIAAIAIPGLLAFFWTLGDAPAVAMARLGLPEASSSGRLFAAAAVSLLPALALSRALFAVAACFAGFARGDWFGARQPLALARAGRWLAVSGALGLVTPTILALVLTLGAGPGERVLTLALSSTPVVAVLFGILLWTLGRLWAAAHALAVENAQFV